MFKSALDILKVKSVKTIRKGAGGFNPASAAIDNSLVFDTTGKKPFIYFRIGRELARKAGLSLDDRVLFGIDRENGLAKLYADPLGWKLVSGNVKSDDPPLVLRATWQPGFPSIASATKCEDVIARTRSIIFKFPEGTSFGPLAKKPGKALNLLEVQRKEPEIEQDTLYIQHKELVEREAGIVKKPVKPVYDCTPEAPEMRYGKPYGRRKTDRPKKR